MSSKLKSINCVVDELYQPLFNDFFKPSVGDYEITEHRLPRGSLVDKWGNKEFLAAIHFKLNKITESIKNGNPDEIVIWSDVDLFFSAHPTVVIQDLLNITKDLDLAVSAESRHNNSINSGFIAIRCNAASLGFYKKFRDAVIKSGWAEQNIMNDMLHSSNGLKWKRMPFRYWNTTIGLPYPASNMMIHVNSIQAFEHVVKVSKASWTEQKYEMLDKLSRSHGWWRMPKLI